MKQITNALVKQLTSRMGKDHAFTEDALRAPLSVLSQSDAMAGLYSIHPPTVPVSSGLSCVSRCTSFAWSDFPVISQSTLDDHELFGSGHSRLSTVPPSSAQALFLRAAHDNEADTRSRLTHDRDYSFSFTKLQDSAARANGTSQNRQSRETHSCSQPDEEDTEGRRRPIKADPANGRRRKYLHVSFSKLMIREHSLVVGDHPCCASGLPLSLGWAHAAQDLVVDVDDYESAKSRRHRRTVSELRMSFHERKNLLKRVMGLTEGDLVRAERRNEALRRREDAACGGGLLHHVPTMTRFV